jgi:hypothetical protein
MHKKRESQVEIIVDQVEHMQIEIGKLISEDYKTSDVIYEVQFWENPTNGLVSLSGTLEIVRGSPEYEIDTQAILQVKSSHRFLVTIMWQEPTSKRYYIRGDQAPD